MSETANDSHDRTAAPLVSILTTEHFTLQGARSATVSDSSGRASLYLSTLSGTLLALSLLGNATDLGVPFVVAALVLAPTLIFLGIVTFVRVLESGLEDSLYARGINRIRHYYLEVAPELKPYFILSDRDDMEGVLINMGLAPGGRSQAFFTTAGMIGVINSVLVGAFVGGLVRLTVDEGLGVIFAAAAVGFGVSAWAHLQFQRRAWVRFGDRHPSRFPSGNGEPIIVGSR